MECKNILNAYPMHDDDKDNNYILSVESPWNWKREKVTIIIKNKETGKEIGSITVLANELKKAVDNCTRSYEYS